VFKTRSKLDCNRYKANWTYETRTRSTSLAQNNRANHKQGCIVYMFMFKLLTTHQSTCLYDQLLCAPTRQLRLSNKINCFQLNSSKTLYVNCASMQQHRPSRLEWSTTYHFADDLSSRTLFRRNLKTYADATLGVFHARQTRVRRVKIGKPNWLTRQRYRRVMDVWKTRVFF